MEDWVNLFRIFFFIAVPLILAGISDTLNKINKKMK